MKVNKVVEKVKEQRFSMRSKLIVSLSAIAAVLLISCVISIMEYTRMSDYVSDLVSDDIDAINVANKLAEMLRQRVPAIRDIRIQIIGPVVGAHCGPSTVSICFFGKERPI